MVNFSICYFFNIHTNYTSIIAMVISCFSGSSPVAGITDTKFGRLVVRPDSGDPAETCCSILKILLEQFKAR